MAASLQLRLTGEEVRRPIKRYTEDPGAYLPYCEARSNFNKFTETGLATSICVIDRAPERVWARDVSR